MRRLFAIVVLLIFLLNVAGSYGLLVGMRALIAKDVTERLDSDMYDLGAEVTFKAPLTVPYGSSSLNYEPAEGEFEQGGSIYRLVKQRIYQDTLYVVCIKDDRSTKAQGALKDFVQTFSDNADEDSDNEKSSVSSVLIKDFISEKISVATGQSGWEADVVNSSLPRNFFDSYYNSIIHPPDNRA